MKKKSRIFIYPLMIMGLVLMLTYSCKKNEEAPGLITSEVSDITKITAKCDGLITSPGSSPIIERGVCWSTGATPTLADSKSKSNTNTVSFTSAITGLSAGTSYHVRAYAINSAGTGFGNIVLFSTLPVDLPVLTTSAVITITETTATGGGNITLDGGSAVTARGVCWSTTAVPTIVNSKTTDGTGTGGFTSALTGLTAGTIYIVRAYATNSAGTAYGSVVSFSTVAPAGAPELTTSDVSNITNITAKCGGNITSGGTSAITTSGVCWSTGVTPTIADSKTTDGTATGSFISTITGLIGGTTYYVRAYATNSVGTGYGPSVSFKTEEGALVDFDGNIYTKVTIGTQIWMVEDLKTTHYNNGDPIPRVTGDAEWAALTTPAYCWLNNDSVTYPNAVIYNWYAVNTGKLCPKGWHIATNDEWNTLANYLGGQTIAGGPLKEIGTDHWDAPNAGATNITGFTAITNGYRYDGSGVFATLGGYSSYYTSTEYLTATDAYQWWMSFDNPNCSESHVVKSYGSPVRCIKDN